MSDIQTTTTESIFKKVTITSNKTFSEIRKAIESQLGRLEVEKLEPLAEKGDRDQLVRYLEAQVGTSGFSIFHSLDQGTGMTTLGSPMKSVYYLIGNVLLAHQMFQFDPSLGLRIPLRVVLFEKASGQVAIEYDMPSSVLGSYETLKNSTVPKLLDEKLFGLLSQAAS